ncbi:MAG: molecular chaperone DnaK [Candidatus Sumerlaeota bacterium]|nr:molecular chaperone DnaK [Candidatus Sumerlaeota bacterium]
MSRILGIDLGTTNSVMSVMEKNGPFVVPNSLGERITPSVVGFSKSGEILVGKKAKRGAIMNVGRTVFSIKRQMGSNHRVRIEGKEYTPQEISGMILQKMKSDAEDYFGEEITQAVITVPAYFTDTQRAATKDAGEIAGFNVRRVIDEPTAAALAYGLDNTKDQRLLVYDLGGGTFDVSIIEIQSGVFQVQAIAGNNMLGGDDFDDRVAKFLVDAFREQHNVDLSEDPIAMQRLREAAEEAKIELSELKETHVLVEAITMTDSGPLTLDTTLSRDRFEELTKDLVESTIPPMEKAIKDANIQISDVDTILLVGGCTRIPAVQRCVREFTNKNANRDISPEEVVAMGAAVQTLVLAPLDGDIEQTLAQKYNREKPVIIHMTPFSLGVGLQGDQFSPVIERNSTYPTEGKDIFTTTRDFQEAISFPIYEGEETTASENTFLDLLRIEGITPAPKGVPRIEVTFRLNPDRILEVTAEDLATGVSKKVVIDATDERLTDSDKNRMIREAKERVSRMLRSKISESRHEEAKNMLERSNATLSALGGDHPMAPELKAMTTRLREALDEGDESLLDDTIDDLLRLLAEIEASA